MQKIVLLIFSIFFFSNVLYSQNDEKTYAFETDLFTPSYKMIKELYAFDKCNEENNLEKSPINYCIRFAEFNGLDKLFLTSSTRIIGDTEVEWNSLIISGAFLFKNRLVLLVMESEKLKRLEFLFKKEDKKIEGKINLDQYGTPACFSTYLIDKQNLKLNYHSNSY
jgi:hypothetical protein